jgi:pimeloyl-ACP methyl ester carboxylesterase
VIPELEARGHRAVAVDLPGEDASATFETYADAVARALEGVDDEVVVAGHSLGGLTIPLVPSRRAVARLVYVCGRVRIPGTQSPVRSTSSRRSRAPTSSARRTGS